jgi:phosphomannomutase
VAIDAELRAAVEAWIADDPDPVDRAELATLLGWAESAAYAEEAGVAGAAPEADEMARQLTDRFAGRLAFGTAGLRGQLGAGPNRMNRAVVRGATSAVADWLLASAPPGDGVVIGCDARHRSDEFADEAARVLAGAGIRAHLLPRPCPTPLVAFAVRQLGAAAGIMITASHNPRTDNGYKLYLADGAQVIPPADSEIEGRIAALGPLREIRTATLGGPLIIRHGDEVAAAYLAAITPAPVAGAATAPRVVYTPMHGVAGPLLLRALQRAGFARPHVVTVQGQADPDFPTAAFPNPEEPAALTLALADARALDADLVLANDPDGDRLAVAVPEPDTRRTPRDEPDGGIALPDGRWRILTGDQVGALLGAYLLAPRDLAPGQLASGVAGQAGQPLVATTIVSSTLLSKIAAAAGAQYRETLTGFKWIARAADDVAGATFAFGYEEAIGYAVGATVRDKDGISAAVAFLSLAAGAARDGQSVLDRYDDLERAHGVHLTSQLSLRIPGTAEVMRRLRAAPPATLDGRPVDGHTDYAAAASGGPSSGLPPSDVLSYRIGRDRVVIRPSGTEPKVKAYFEIVEPVPPGGLIAARMTAQRRLRPLREAVGALLTGMTTITGQHGGLPPPGPGRVPASRREQPLRTIPNYGSPGGTSRAARASPRAARAVTAEPGAVAAGLVPARRDAGDTRHDRHPRPVRAHLQGHRRPADGAVRDVRRVRDAGGHELQRHAAGQAGRPRLAGHRRQPCHRDRHAGQRGHLARGGRHRPGRVRDLLRRGPRPDRGVLDHGAAVRLRAPGRLGGRGGHDRQPPRRLVARLRRGHPRGAAAVPPLARRPGPRGRGRAGS